MNEPWRIELLNGLRVRGGDRLITRFRSQRTALLLAFLAYYHGRGHPREVLTELLWPDSEPEAARHSLSQALSSLRHQLEPPGVPAGAVIVADRSAVELNPEACVTDVREFEAALRTANQARHGPDYAVRLAEAADQYTGLLLLGFYEEWVLTEQERLRERFAEAVLQLVPLLERSGETERGLAYARRVVDCDPLREAGHQAMMRLHVAAGRPEAALRQYRELERLLKEELETAPSAATRQLVRQIEAQWLGLPGQRAEGGELRPIRGEPVLSPQPSALSSSPSALSSQPPALPAGTVTFLLTDIEGSTALWERLGDAYKPLIAFHHQALRAVFRRRGGHEVKEAGDSFLVAFGAATDALDCAIDAQHALAALAREPVQTADPAALSVRMALHTGDVELCGGEYRGLALHRASRILGAGHGGQILCSETTATLLSHDLGARARLSDLGLYLLRGVEGAVRLFQVEYPEMARGEWPALQAEPAQRGSVPLQFDRFFGRDTELSRLQEVLEPAAPAGAEGPAGRGGRRRSRLLTLTGPGGAGKTRLAIEVAGLLFEAYRGAVWFVPLADLTDARLIGGTILDALGVPRSASAEPLDQAVEALGRQPSLLILDNFEQLVEGGAALVRTLLDRAPSLQCLVTSRQVLAVPGERTFAVPPLPTPNGVDTPERLSLFDSVRLFIDRAQAVLPDFQVTTGNAAAVAELCDRLEGIPLAIELAAARTVVLTPAQMLAQLGNRFELLATRRRGIAERHRTLRAAVDWSYRLLAPELQRFLARLSVFRGGWSVAAAEAVCEEPLALDYLAELLECSLVQTDEGASGVRFRMLEMVRDYAAQKIEAATAERHARYFLDLVEQSRPGQSGWLRRLEEEQHNLRQALHWFGATDGQLRDGLRLACLLRSYWDNRGHVREGRDHLSRLLAAGDDPSSVARAEALRVAGGLACLQSDYAAARALLDESLAIFRQARDERGIAGALDDLGWAVQCLGDGAAAREMYEEALALYRKLGDHGGVAKCLNQLGGMAEEPARRRRMWEESLALNREVGNRLGVANNLMNLGTLATNAGDFMEACTVFEESLAIFRECGAVRRTAGPLYNLGNALKCLGDYAAAAPLLEESLAIWRETGFKSAVAVALNNLGNVAREQGDFPRARQRYQEALGINRVLVLPAPAAKNLLNLGKTALGEGNVTSARALFEESLAELRGLDRGIHAEVLHALGTAAAAAGDYAAAFTFQVESLTARRQFPDRPDVAESLESFARLAVRQGQGRRAARLFGAAEGLRTRMGSCLAPIDQPEHEHAVLAGREALGTEAFEDAHTAGRSLEWEAAVEEALQEDAGPAAGKGPVS